MKTTSIFIIMTFIVGSMLFARNVKGLAKFENRGVQLKNEHSWIEKFSESNDQIDRKRSHKRRRKIRKPVKGLR